MEDIELGAVTEHNIKLPNSSKSSNTPLIQTVQSDNKQKTLINEVNMCDTERDSEKGLDTWGLTIISFRSANKVLNDVCNKQGEG